MSMRTEQKLLEIAAETADQAILALNRDHNPIAAIAISTMAIAQALTAIGEILQGFGGKKNANGQKEIPGRLETDRNGEEEQHRMDL